MAEDLVFLMKAFLYEDIGLIGTDCIGSDNDPFDQLMGIRSDQGTIFIGARLSLSGITADIFLLPLFLGCQLPFFPCRKTRPSPAPKTGSFYFIKDLFWGQFP